MKRGNWDGGSFPLDLQVPLLPGIGVGAVLQTWPFQVLLQVPLLPEPTLVHKTHPPLSCPRHLPILPPVNIPKLFLPGLLNSFTPRLVGPHLMPTGYPRGWRDGERDPAPKASAPNRPHSMNKSSPFFKKHQTPKLRSKHFLFLQLLDSRAYSLIPFHSQVYRVESANK